VVLGFEFRALLPRCKWLYHLSLSPSPQRLLKVKEMRETSRPELRYKVRIARKIKD
jgi:hypothetical protein